MSFTRQTLANVSFIPGRSRKERGEPGITIMTMKIGGCIAESITFNNCTWGKYPSLGTKKNKTVPV